MGIELPNEYQPSGDEEFMNPMHVEYFRRRLEQLRADLRQALNAILPP
jgi:DnaK suppressor protein